MKLENKHRAPESFMRFCASDSYSRGDSDFSATDLIEEPRIVALKRMYPDMGTEDPYENPWKYISTIFHSLMESHSPDGEVAEQRLFSEIDGVKISGAMDVQVISNGNVTIGDYKMTTSYAIKDTKKWEQQLNIYAWLVERESGYSVRELLVYAFIRDWKISMSEKIADYPSTPGLTIDIPLWDFSERQAFIEARVDLHSRCASMSEAELPACSEESRWPSGTLWSVEYLLDSNEPSKKFFRTKRDANKFIDSLSFEDQLFTNLSKTYETFRRCKSYCEFSDVCSVWNEWKGSRQYD